MAEALFQVVFENLISLIKTEIVLILGVDGEMKKLCNTLTTIQAVLEDAELKQIENLPIQDWLRKVNAVAYEIDDILDDCNTHLSKLNQPGKTLSRYILTFAVKLLHRSEIAKRMKQVNAELDSIDSDRRSFHLREMQVDRSREVAASARETCSFMNDPDTIYGRIEDTDEILKVLVEDVSENQQLSVLPIIGVGGLGKTTLAQLVFNHPRVVKHFEKRIWVCVSDDFDIKTLVKAMIESKGGAGRAADMQHLDAPVHYLRELLSQKRYLIVLDDVWNEHQENWSKLKDILSCVSTGASIIVTTRLKKVADIMKTLLPHCLKGLSDEHCWMLLRQRAEEYPELEVIGKQIVEKCAGVPLAAKALGGILRFKRTEEEWIYVRESEIWMLPQEDCSILPVLRLSYHHLPLELRQCFAYFAAFPKDCKVGKEELIRLWMAHGFISSKGALQVEEVGNEICNELILRSLLQPNHDYNHSMSMHDLVHDLAQLVMETRVPGKQIQRNVTSASTIREVNLLHRTVMFPKTFQQDMDMSSILKLKCLRVINARSTWIQKLPHSICNLKHLRYLNLSSSKIRTLPNSLCTLWNLQTLDLYNCYRLLALPKKTKNLRNLRHLSLRHCELLSEMPSKMSKLTHLKTLSMFVVGHKKGNQLEELQCLNLSGRLEIRHLERVKDHLDAKQANIVEKKNLRDLSLSWERNSVAKSGEEDVDEKVLEALEPHPNLEKFTISGLRGRYFPVWMTNSTLTKIVRMEIENCINCRRLPKLGELPHLRILRLTRVGVEYIIDEEVGSGNQGMVQFLALKDLSLYNLPNLKGISRELECKEAFPNLKRLTIGSCSSSVVPPISSLRKLEDLSCSSSILPLFSKLNTLTELYVSVEEEIACFPIETLMKFTNLQTLTIRGAKEISVTEEGLQALKKLQRLKMACLPEALQHLSSLTRLDLSRLPQLESIPGFLEQLTSLEIEECAKIVSVPALPNLKELTIRQCPQLERRCRRDDWHKIALIPYLLIPGVCGDLDLGDRLTVLKAFEILRGSSVMKVDLGKVPKLGVIPRYAEDEDEMCWVDAPGLNLLHTANSWEEEEADGESEFKVKIVIVGTNLKSVEHVVEDLDMVDLSLEKIVIDVSKKVVTRFPLSNRRLDFPVINPKYAGKKNRYVYAVVFGEKTPKMLGVVKIDLWLCRGDGSECTVACRMYGADCYGSEPMFVARAEAEAEDDGYLVTYVSSEKRDESHFVVMDAKSPTLQIVAAVKLPRRVPQGFHSIFLKQTDLFNM